MSCRCSAIKGLSPRVRGNPKQPPERAVAEGSIPACAGEPYYIGYRVRISEVYPRVCGGTTASLAYWFARWGLSPRVRGNPWAGVC